jgi:hypothetical protein
MLCLASRFRDRPATTERQPSICESQQSNGWTKDQSSLRQLSESQDQGKAHQFTFCEDQINDFIVVRSISARMLSMHKAQAVLPGL